MKQHYATNGVEINPLSYLVPRQRACNVRLATPPNQVAAEACNNVSLGVSQCVVVIDSRNSGFRGPLQDVVSVNVPPLKGERIYQSWRSVPILPMGARSLGLDAQARDSIPITYCNWQVRNAQVSQGFEDCVSDTELIIGLQEASTYRISIQ